ncbi:MAG: thioredoxin family protein [Flavobacteriales bacterium TMED191]|nr:MAG: thioredoxin family protein [Flavobacteriales bacterium TMED191]|tara:strand:- start:1159 stop:1740 length:582 start_codon:yes stop_codon:yes gene_type:complete
MYIKRIFVFSICGFLFFGCSNSDQKSNKIIAQNKVVTNKTQTVQSNSNIEEKSDWLINYDEVYNKSIKENKPILANFTGSDWCGWCKKLKKAVFDTETFKKWASENVVLFELDYPRRTQQDPIIKRQNAELQQTFRGLVRGYPTVLIFDIERELQEDGSKSQDKIKIHGQRMGYMPDPNSFINTAEANLKNRE